jgi:hypothetical protein
MSRNHTLFLFVVLGALALAAFQKVGHKVHDVGASTTTYFHP